MNAGAPVAAEKIADAILGTGATPSMNPQQENACLTS
jgi:hypothetical protein